MTDIRKCAQAVIDIWNDPSLAIEPAIEALRQALQAEPVEPVEAMHVGTRPTYETFYNSGMNIQIVWEREPPHGAKLYTAPPSVAVEPVCNPHPDAPHGFNRNASHTEDRYVCDCESWEPPSVDALIAEIEAIVTCAETAVDFDTGDTCYIGEAYPKEDVLAILDKYRSMK